MDACTPRGGSIGLGDENMGGGGMGPISVTPIGGSGSDRLATLAPLGALLPLPDGTAAAADGSVAATVGVCTVMPMTGDRLGGCDEAVVVMAPGAEPVCAEDEAAEEDDDAAAELDDDVTATTGMTDSVAALPGGSLEATDGEPEPC